MPAYVLVEATNLDAVRATEYRHLAEASIASYGGRYLIQGATPEVAEGEWPAGRVVTAIEFPSVDRIREWYHSPEYQEAIAVRAGAIDLRLLFVEGVAGPW
ncbi:uncharacterized protein (DUF1330 family) [Nocardia transvalensis]|uniref:Uncharacterized protein (DUF1330 family) n=1 Tax=Nocardia transvalensis TaxID=37333 RepID=A0A7W9ULH6_9NOCA|nr:DUF1330 domain-containing protein [Nocardia transvalensis]MBB5917554.1 uncharacterized protein (DUF1330 family) [Nocardia transvalensis]